MNTIRENMNNFFINMSGSEEQYAATNEKLDKAYKDSFKYETNRYFMNERNKSKVFILANNNRFSKRLIGRLIKKNNYCLFVLYCLLYVMDKYNSCEITQQEIADNLGISREYVNKIFAILIDQKIVWRLPKKQGNFKAGTYFINQNYFAKQSLDTLTFIPASVPSYMRRYKKFDTFTSIDAHKDSFRFVIKELKCYVKAFNTYFASYYRITMTNVILDTEALQNLCKVRKTVNGKTVYNTVKDRTFKRYVNYLKNKGFITINEYGKIQLNHFFVWSKYYSRKHEDKMFGIDLAGIEDNRIKSSKRWWDFKEIMLKANLSSQAA